MTPTATTTQNQVVARGNLSSEAYTTRAVLYVRVSSIAQVKTDRDGEGFSIAAQRDACHQKAAALGAEVVEVYTDAAESARKADRPQLQAMLTRLQAERDIDYVIVHKLDRLARNRGDDVTITMEIRQAGAQLVSVTENIDESPSGMLVHGIMSSIAEFYSQNLATEVIKGTRKKVERGWYPGRAPIGYVNRQDLTSGNSLRWIEVDPERADLVRWAFEAYATGDYTLRQLTEALEERGLKSRPTAQHVARAMGVNHVHRMLSRRFYLGYFNWQGVEYEGNHEPLVSVETFATVQAIMHSRRQSGDKPQKHPQYLKGTIRCARCDSPMLFTRNRGRRGGIYDYFGCMGRHTKHTGCELPYLPASAVETAILDYYGTIVLGPELVEKIKSYLLKVARRRNQQAERLAVQARRRVIGLEKERRKLLQAHLAGAVPLDLMQEEQTRITKELANAGAALANVEVHWEKLEQNLGLALELSMHLQEAYEAGSPATRRRFNQAIFEVVHVDVDGAIYARLAQPFKSLLDEGFFERLEREWKNPAPSEERGLNLDELVVLRCHKAKPFAQVDGPTVELPAPNTVMRRGTGDR